MVTNVTGETPTLESAAVNGTTLTLLYDEALDQGSVPVIGDFTVTVAGSTVSVTGVAMTRSAVVLTLADAVTAGQRVTVSYTRGANPIRDTHANRYKAANLDGVAVDNRASDTRAPRLVSATVQGNVLTLVYDEALDPSRKPHANRFYVSVDVTDPNTGNTTPTRANVNAVVVTGRMVILTLDLTVQDGWHVDLNYVNIGPGGEDFERIQDLAGNFAPRIPLETVTYGPPPATAPSTPPRRPAPPSGGGGVGCQRTARRPRRRARTMTAGPGRAGDAGRLGEHGTRRGRR